MVCFDEGDLVDEEDDLVGEADLVDEVELGISLSAVEARVTRC